VLERFLFDSSSVQGGGKDVTEITWESGESAFREQLNSQWPMWENIPVWS